MWLPSQPIDMTINLSRNNIAGKYKRDEFRLRSRHSLKVKQTKQQISKAQNEVQLHQEKPNESRERVKATKATETTILSKEVGKIH
jgi:hypothetical protein